MISYIADKIVGTILAGAPFAWSDTGHICGRENLTMEQSALLDAILASYDPIAVLIAAKRSSIQAAKVSARDAGFDVSGTHFDSDTAARISYGELADMLRADPTYATPWRASPGAWVTMDAALYAQVQTAGAAHIRSVFAWQAARDGELAAIQAAVAAGTMSESDAIAAVTAVSTICGEVAQ